MIVNLWLCAGFIFMCGAGYYYIQGLKLKNKQLESKLINLKRKHGGENAGE